MRHAMPIRQWLLAGALVLSGACLCSPAGCTEIPPESTDSGAEAGKVEPGERPDAPELPSAETPSQPTSESQSDTSESRSDTSESEKEGQQKPSAPIRREIDGFDFIAGLDVDPSPSHQARSVYLAIRRAYLHIKLGAAEHGNVVAFQAAREELDRAAQNVGKSGDQRTESVDRLVKNLQREADQLKQVADASFFGKFPLVRGFGMEVEDNEEFEVRSYAMVGEAQRSAIRSALKKIGETASTGPLHVLVLVPARETDSLGAETFAALVDAEARLALANTTHLKLYPGELRREVDPMPAWTSPDSAFDTICRQFLSQTGPATERRGVMLIMVREFTDDAGDGCVIQAQQRTFEASSLEKAEDHADKLEADRVRSSEYLARDRSRMRYWILGGIAVLLLLSWISHGVLSMTSGMPAAGWQRGLAIPTAGFVIGLGLPPLIMLAFQEWIPDPHTSALSAAWWPALAGALTLILPAGVFRLIAGAIGRFVPVLSCQGRWGTAFVPVALGSAAAWIRPASYALGAHGVSVVLAIAVAGSILVYCFGRAVDLADRFPVAMAPLVLILALVYGTGAFLGSTLTLGAVAGIAAATTAGLILLGRRHDLLVAAGQQTTGFSGVRPQSLEELRQVVETPIYQPPPEFETLRGMIERSGLTKSRWIGLTGPSAAGKTAAARYLISLLQSSTQASQVLVGRCTEDSPPYQCFREALAQLGLPSGLLGTQGGEVNHLFERLADEFIPFWDFFSGNSDDDESGSRQELFSGVSNALRQLAANQQIVLFLDDIQWIDEGSTALLKHLREHLAPGGDTSLVIVLASRDPEVLKHFDLMEDVVSLTPPSADGQVRILEHSLGIERASVRRLVDALGVFGQQAGGMFWLLRAVRELLDDNAFVATRRGFALQAEYLRPGRLPVPAAMRAKMIATLRESGEQLPVLECAALLGERFRVDELAQCLETDQLKMLQVLRHLDLDRQLVRDVPADPHCYAFSSPLLHAVIREELGVSPQSAASGQKPTKIARELHARIASVLEQRTPRTSKLACRIAQHSFDAGSAYASQSAERCLDAARMTRQANDLEASRRYLKMARQSARLAHCELDESVSQAGVDSLPPRPAEEDRAITLPS